VLRLHILALQLASVTTSNTVSRTKKITYITKITIYGSEISAEHCPMPIGLEVADIGGLQRLTD
jgi:hypothetical protein